MFIVLGLYIPEPEICFCIPLRLSGPHAIRWIEKLLNCQTPWWVLLGCSQWGATPKQHCGSEFVLRHAIYTLEECVDEWRQNNTDYKWLCYSMVSLCSASCSWLPLDWRIRHNHMMSRQFHSLVPGGDIHGKSSKKSPQSIGELGFVMDTWLI